ncbi:hypothetical protein [Nitrosopumilus sp.]|uniref:hypothetical protein n=1 Tax=Nitrosopumilus sp. TaxID=2024843 RepID=UPI00247DDD47|nr:hypothetical protein [Nitrosopumilus sp.]MCV0410511.1 hypothetical protein [Nitrosopumilus sp.]
MVNSQNQNKTIQYTGCVGIKYTVDTPKLYTVRKTALFGMFSLLSVLLLNVPTMLENTYAYGSDGFESLESIDERSLARNHFITGSPIDPSQIAEYYDSNRSEALEERTNLRNHFSYEQKTSETFSVDQTTGNSYEKRRA